MPGERLIRQLATELADLVGRHVQATKLTRSALQAYEQGADRDQLSEYLDAILAWLEGSDDDGPTDEEPGVAEARADA